MLAFLANGHGQKAIAHELSISSKTVATHIQNLLGKTGAHSRAEVAAWAYQLGVVQTL